MQTLCVRLVGEKRIMGKWLGSVVGIGWLAVSGTGCLDVSSFVTDGPPPAGDAGTDTGPEPHRDAGELDAGYDFIFNGGATLRVHADLPRPTVGSAFDPDGEVTADEYDERW